jgi:fructose-bisphosphate aldolase class I
LTEGVSFQQSDEAFNATLNDAIEGIYQASNT